MMFGSQQRADDEHRQHVDDEHQRAVKHKLGRKHTPHLRTASRKQSKTKQHPDHEMQAFAIHKDGRERKLRRNGDLKRQHSDDGR